MNKKPLVLKRKRPRWSEVDKTEWGTADRRTSSLYLGERYLGTVRYHGTFQMRHACVSQEWAGKWIPAGWSYYASVDPFGSQYRSRYFPYSTRAAAEEALLAHVLQVLFKRGVKEAT